MTIEDLRALVDYGGWTRTRLMEVLGGLAAEEFTRRVGPGHGSVRDTIVHIVSTDWGWLERCGGPARGPRLDPADYPTLASVASRWAAVEEATVRFLEGLSDADVAREVEYAGGAGVKCTMPIGELMRHAANHAVHHRGQLALHLRRLGYAPPALDLLYYFAERRGVRAW